MSNPIVGVVMGSDSDLPVVEKCLKCLTNFGISYEVRIISAHRTPEIAHEYSATAKARGLKVIIAAAGMSAALSGVLAASTTLPIIGIPMCSGPLAGVDAALSTLQMPPGIPVGAMAINGAKNAAIYAAQIIALTDDTLAEKLTAFKKDQAAEVVKKDSALQSKK